MKLLSAIAHAIMFEVGGTHCEVMNPPMTTLAPMPIICEALAPEAAAEAVVPPEEGITVVVVLTGVAVAAVTGTAVATGGGVAAEAEPGVAVGSVKPALELAVTDSCGGGVAAAAEPPS
jgi:hypothetical protein